jgi:hypothetical protein
METPGPLSIDAGGRGQVSGSCGLALISHAASVGKQDMTGSTEYTGGETAGATSRAPRREGRFQEVADWR